MDRKEISTVAAFAPLELGDTILATPLYKALRDLYPSAHLTALSQLQDHPVLAGFNTFDSIVDYHPGINLSGDFDLVVLPVLCGDGEVRRHFESHANVISADRLYAARRQSVSNHWNGKYSHVLFYRHQVEMNMELACEAGYEGETPTPYCPPGDSTGFERYRGKVGLFINTPMNEFQAMPNRQWPVEHWKAIVAHLGVGNTLLIGGPTDRPNVQRLADETNAPFAITSSLSEFTGLCRVLRVLATTDGGAMHAAATTGVAIVSLHGTSSPILLHPWIYPEGKCIAVLSPNTCSPCQRSFRLQVCENGLTRMDCMQNIRPDLVARAINEIDNLDPGTCLIMKGDNLMSKTAYLQSWKRKLEFTLNYNAARIALRLTSRGRKEPLARWTNALEDRPSEKLIP
jgi:ADP-heptose:LPS heptosyltransferase